MVNNINNTQRFIPLEHGSQVNHCNVLYYDRLAPIEAMYELSKKRLQAACELVSVLRHLKQPDTVTLSSISNASHLLLSDAMSTMKAIYLHSK